MAAKPVAPVGNPERQRKIIDLLHNEGYPMSADSIAYRLKFANGFSDAIAELRVMEGTRVAQYRAGRVQVWKLLPGGEIGMVP